MPVGLEWLLGGFLLTAATLGTAAAKHVSSVPLPEPHAWDNALMMLASMLQYMHVLAPLAMLAASLWSSLLIFGCILYIFYGDRITALYYMAWPIFVVPAGIKQLLMKRAQFRNLLRVTTGGQYISFYNMFNKLYDIFGIAAGFGDMTACKLVVIAALMSWQEWLCCCALAAWTLLAFTPDLMKPGAGWPLEDATSWALMQMDWAWGQKWVHLLQAILFGVFLVGCRLMFEAWNERRLDLQSIPSVRRSVQSPKHVPNMAIPAHLVSRPHDKPADRDLKAARLGLILAKAYAKPSLEEQLSFPWLTLLEFFFLLGFIYGITFGIVGARDLTLADHPVAYLFLAPLLLLAGFFLVLSGSQPVGWVAAAAGLFVTWGVAEYITLGEQGEWLATNKARHSLHKSRGHLSSRAGTTTAAFAEAKQGPFPSTKLRLLGWVWFWARVVFAGLCGFLFISWNAQVHYLPAYGLPAYSSPYGDYYCGVKTCLEAVAFERLGGGLQSRGGCARGGAGCGANGAANFWAGWWGDLKLAARVNVLAARAWRKNGLEGVRLAMDALMAATSPDVLAGPEVRRRAVRALRDLEQKGMALVDWRKGGFSVWSSPEKDLFTDDGTSVIRAAPVRSAQASRSDGDGRGSGSGSSGAGASMSPSGRDRSGAASEAGRDLSGKARAAGRAAAREAREEERAAPISSSNAARDTARCAACSAYGKASEVERGVGRSEAGEPRSTGSGFGAAHGAARSPTASTRGPESRSGSAREQGPEGYYGASRVGPMDLEEHAEYLSILAAIYGWRRYDLPDGSHFYGHDFDHKVYDEFGDEDDDRDDDFRDSCLRFAERDSAERDSSYDFSCYGYGGAQRDVDERPSEYYDEWYDTPYQSVQVPATASARLRTRESEAAASCGGSSSEGPQAYPANGSQLPLSSDPMDEVAWCTLFVLASVAVVAAFLVVMQPKWLQSPGKYLSAVVGLLTWARRTGTRRAKPPKEAPADSGRPGGKKAKQQPLKAGAQRQQKQEPATASAPKAGAAAGGRSGSGQAATPTPARGRTGGSPAAGPVIATSERASSLKDAGADSPRNQQPPRVVSGAAAAAAAVSASPATRSAYDATSSTRSAYDATSSTRSAYDATSSTRHKGQAAGAQSGGGSAAGSAKATYVTTPPPSASSPIAAPSSQGAVGSRLVGPVTATATATQPFAASCARQTHFAAPAPAAAPLPTDTAAAVDMDSANVSAPLAAAAAALPEPTTLHIPSPTSYAASVLTPSPTPTASAVWTPAAAPAPAAATTSAAATRQPVTARPTAVASTSATPKQTPPPATRPQPPARPFGQSLCSSAVSRQPAAPPPRAAALTAAASAATTAAAAAAAASPVSSSTDSVPDGNDASVPVPVPVRVPVPIQVPVPVKGSAPVSPGTPEQLPTPPSEATPSSGFLGLNPALARGLASLGRLAPAASDTARLQGARPAAAAGPNGPAAAARSGSNTSPPGGAIPPPRGGVWGNAPGLHPDYCGICQAHKREVCVLHGCTVHLSLCSGCAAGFSLGSPCPLCGEPVVQKFPFDVSKL